MLEKHQICTIFKGWHIDMLQNVAIYPNLPVLIGNYFRNHKPT